MFPHRIVLIALLLAGCNDKPTREPSADAERAKRGPYVTMSKDISDHENIRVVIIPHPWGQPFDTACVIHTNREFKTTNMQCPAGVEQSLPETARP